MNKLRTWLPGQHAKDSARHSVTLEPEIGFQITIEMHDQKEDNQQSFTAANGSSPMPELNVHLIAARHLPSLFGFKIVQGYLIKVIHRSLNKYIFIYFIEYVSNRSNCFRAQNAWTAASRPTPGQSLMKTSSFPWCPILSRYIFS